MSSPASDAKPAVRPADLVITLIFLVMFAGAYFLAEQWPFRAAFFPQLLAMLGLGFAVLKLLGLGVTAIRARKAPTEVATAATAEGGQIGLVSEEEEEDESLEYVFATAGRNAWAAALGWWAFFFLGLWLFGVFIAVPVFSFLYLKLSGGAGWLAAALYAIIGASVLYIAFERLLTIPMPEGIF